MEHIQPSWPQPAWDAVEQQKLEELISSMKDRCQAVIDANGMHTRF